MTVQENISLSKYTTFHVGGPAKYFVEVKNDADIHAALEFASKQQLPFFILGKGSNTLFPDSGYPGVVIHIADRSLSLDENNLTSASGVFMRQLVNFALDHNLRGLEELAGIPGTVGGAIRGNAGTWQTEIKDHLKNVEVIKWEDKTKTWVQQTLTREQCQFSYRHSIFKKQPLWIVLRATFTLQPGDGAAGQELVQKDLDKRHARQPYDAPSAGSIFKNPDAAGGVYAGQLIENLNLKGTCFGGAEISQKHANFIVNREKATATDILGLIQVIQEKVHKAHGINLEPEIVIVPPNPDVKAS